VSELLRKGRLTSVRKDVVEFTSSAEYDRKILKHVVSINKAHVVMLVETEIVSSDDGAKILGALVSLDRRLELSAEVEDAHMAVEEEVIRATGDAVGGNLNLAKSRNDQVATAIRMNLRQEILELAEVILLLEEVLIQKAEDDPGKIIVAYTHLQPAQPVTFAHYLLAQCDVLRRDLQRLREAYGRVDLCPMGAGALATTSFSISRELVADLLGFAGVLENSLDAVGSRDFVLEVLAALSVLAVDVTRLVEDLVVWSTSEFGTVKLPDGFAFTSSIMPQKKNPDVLEVIRSRMSMIIGGFVASATVLKSLPSTYNMDFQEVTPKLWEAFETARSCLAMFSKLVPDLEVGSTFPAKPALTFITSTELANMLVRNHKVPFRTAHRIVGAVVKKLLEEDRSLNDLTPELLAQVSKEILESPLNVEAKEVQSAVDPSSFIESHKVRGGPSEREVGRMLILRREWLDVDRAWFSQRSEKLKEAEKSLDSRVESLMSVDQQASSNRKV